MPKVIAKLFLQAHSSAISRVFYDKLRRSAEWSVDIGRGMARSIFWLAPFLGRLYAKAGFLSCRGRMKIFRRINEGAIRMHHQKRST